jgi:ABC-type lipoprotein export system ATPase subunit
LTSASDVGLDVVVSASDLGIAYRGVPVIEGVNIEIARRGEVVISGRSGSGKTSLLLVLAGLIAPSTGVVAWPGLQRDDLLRRAQIAMVFQAPSLIPELTAVENVCLPLRLRGTNRVRSLQAALDALGRVGLGDAQAYVLPHELSGGEQQRVAVARSIATRPRLLLADEPSGSLDRATAAIVVAALREAVTQDGSSLVVATHDDEIAALFENQVAVEDRSVRWLRTEQI